MTLFRTADTVSGVVGVWFSWPWLGWWTLGAFGFVTGHLVGMMDPHTPLYWWRVGLFLSVQAVGFALTRWPV